MGFATKTPSMPNPTSVIPVVTDTDRTDTATDYLRQNNRRRGLAASILSPAPAATVRSATDTANRTLG